MNQNKPIAALFDLDGVVFDTEPQYTIFWNGQGEKYRPELDNFGSRIKGQTLPQILNTYFPEDVHASIIAKLDAYQKNMAYNYIPYVEKFMASLRGQGIKIAIVTSSDEQKMEYVYQAHPTFYHSVDHILTAGMFARSKPDPDCFLLGAKVLGAPIENCVVFEDSFHGLEAARRAGMKIVGLCTTNSEESIRDKANIVIKDYLDFTVEKMLSLLG